MRVLVVEDEVKVRNFLKKGLSSHEMVVDAVATVDELFASLLSISYDVIILDRLLGGIDSLKTISEIRKKSPGTKILILSALSEVGEKVKGLTNGADDYLGKPFHVEELIARLRALTRRSSGSASSDTCLNYEDLMITFSNQRVEREGKRVELTPKEYKLLVFLLKRPNHIFSKVDLLNGVWELDYYPESNVVEVVMNHLRNKIDKGFKRELIHSRRGVGYWLGDENC